jgi:hypothetical protein
MLVAKCCFSGYQSVRAKVSGHRPTVCISNEDCRVTVSLHPVFGRVNNLTLRACALPAMEKRKGSGEADILVTRTRAIFGELDFGLRPGWSGVYSDRCRTYLREGFEKQFIGGTSFPAEFSGRKM